MSSLSVQIERFRPYLRLLAEAQTDQALKARVDLSGVVQQSLWEGSRTVASLGPANMDEIARLLRRILTNNLHDEIRRATTQKRDVRLERSIESSSLRLSSLLTGRSPTPSQHAVINERAVLIAEAVMMLSEDQREVVVRHYLTEDSIENTAQTMNRSVASVAGLLHRALKELRRILEQKGIGSNG